MLRNFARVIAMLALTSLAIVVSLLLLSGSQAAQATPPANSPCGRALIKDINTNGSEGAYPMRLTFANDKLFFLATDGNYNLSLWVSDGTPSGTIPLKSIFGVPVFNYLAAVGDTLFFTNNTELWRSDGTLAGTMIVRNFNYIGDLIDGSGRLFLVADDGISGLELWVSDGTLAGTTLVRDIRPGRYGSNPEKPVNVNGTLFFDAYSPADSAVVLFKSDGTSEGTVVVTDVYSFAIGAPWDPINVNGTLFFGSGRGDTGMELWRSDGTPAGSYMVKDIHPGPTGSYPDHFANANGMVYFVVDAGSQQVALWKSDGTSAGTVPVKVLPGEGYLTWKLTGVGRTLFFRTDDGVHGPVLWKSDGTEAGTQMLAGSQPDHLVAVDGLLFFEAADGVNGAELWASNGTQAGTWLYADLNPGTANGFSLDNGIASDMIYANGSLFFGGDDGIHGNELWTLKFCKWYVNPWLR